MSKERTSLINGFFIWIVFISHLQSYGIESQGADLFISKILGFIGQCCVATFFFYSGYGIMTKLHMKQAIYARQLITKRFPTLLLHMTIAVCVFWGVQTLYGQEYELKQILLSFIAWDAIGNSNWFIFITLSSYLIIASSFLLWHKVGESMVALSTAFMLICVIFVVRNKGPWWYNTCLCIPAGMIFCIWRKRIEDLISVLNIPVWIWGLLLILTSLILYNFMPWPASMNNIAAILFAFGITLLFSCISIRNPPLFLCWSGGPALFYLYIFQRIPMIIGAKAEWNQHHLFLYELFCFVSTLLIAKFCSKIFPIADKFLLKK